MLPIFLYSFALIAALIHVWNGNKEKSGIEVLLSYILLLNVGVMCIIGFIMHVFYPETTAQMIGWAPGSPFQFEIGMANLAFGVLGLLAFWLRGHFWTATIIGVSVFMIGCFIGHVHQYYAHDNTATLNIGPFIWFNDLFLPITYLVLLYLWLTQSFVPPQTNHLRNNNRNK